MRLASIDMGKRSMLNSDIDTNVIDGVSTFSSDESTNAANDATATRKGADAHVSDVTASGSIIQISTRHTFYECTTRSNPH